MATFEFTNDLHADLLRFRADLKVAEHKKECLFADIETKRTADIEIARRIHALATELDITFTDASREFFARASADPHSDDASLIGISVAGVRTMTKNPSVRM